MKKISIALPDKLSNALNIEADRLEISIDSLVEGLIKKFLEKQNVNSDDLYGGDRRASPRMKLKQSAILYFKTDNGKYGLYKSGDLRDIAQGGVLVECDANINSDEIFKAGSEFELIFQLQEDQPPVRTLCKVCRVMQSENKTKMGVAFAQLDEENQKAMLDFLN